MQLHWQYICSWKKKLKNKKIHRLAKIQTLTFVIPMPQGDTPDFKLQGWSNGGKNQNPQKSLTLNLTAKKSHAKFPSHNFKFPESIKITWKMEILAMECLCLFCNASKYLNSCKTSLILITLFAELHGQDSWKQSQIFRLFWMYTKKNPKLNQPTPKNTCPNFPTQKILKSEISNPEKILQSSLSLENRSTPLGLKQHFINHELSIPGKENEDEMMKNFKYLKRRMKK